MSCTARQMVNAEGRHRQYLVPGDRRVAPYTERALRRHRSVAMCFATPVALPSLARLRKPRPIPGSSSASSGVGSQAILTDQAHVTRVTANTNSRALLLPAVRTRTQ